MTLVGLPFATLVALVVTSANQTEDGWPLTELALADPFSVAKLLEETSSKGLFQVARVLYETRSRG